MFVIEYNSTEQTPSNTIVRVMLAGPDLIDQSFEQQIVHYDVYLEAL